MMKAKHLLMCSIGLSFFSSPLTATLPTVHNEMTIDAQHVESDGKQIQLEGHVLLEHEMGILQAQKAMLHLSTEGSKKVCDKVLLNDNVKLQFHEGGNLTCTQADLNCQTLQGEFTGAQDGFVEYNENCRDKKNVITPITVKSRHMVALLLNDPKATKKLSKPTIASIQADNDVFVDYNHTFFAFADKGVYQRFQTQTDASIPGLIILQRQSTENQPGVCQVKNKDGTIIKATEITIDTVKREVAFNHPEGVLQNASNKSISFHCDEMTWDDAVAMLRLHGAIEVDQEGVGKLQADQEIRLFQHVEGPRREIKSIESDGKTILLYINEDETLSHTLTSYGTIQIDHQKMESRLYSPVDDQGKVLANCQAVFQDAKGEIRADKALIQYRCENNVFTPIKVVLAGNVKISNHLADSKADPKNDTPSIVHQYVLADRVEFFPGTKEMFFKAAAGRRVLFLDQANTLEVSAPSLKIYRDKASKKETIQGYGDVRFNFVERELDQLRQQFSLEKQDPPAKSK